MLLFIILILILFAFIIGTTYMSLWLMDIENPKSFWYNDNFCIFFASLPFVNIFFALVTTDRFKIREDDNE